MKRTTAKRNGAAKPCYDVIHFEALGAEARCLERETAKAIKRQALPSDHKCLITPASVQEYLKDQPCSVFPEIITTKTHSVLPTAYLVGCRKSIITRSAGYDHFEKFAKRANITSLREYCVNAVAQTTMKFLFAAAGQLNHYVSKTETFERKACAKFMELGKNRTLTVFGVGKIGRRIYELAMANGLNVQGVDLRASELSHLYNDEVRFVSREEALRTSDVIINAMNLTRNRKSCFFNVGYFSREYLLKAKKGLIFINVTRGEIAPETVLLEGYRSGVIAGIGLDVFSREAEFANLLKGAKFTTADLVAGRTLVSMSLQRTGNIYVQPHQGFYSDVAVKAKAVETIRHLVAWHKNNRQHFDVQLPYY